MKIQKAKVKNTENERFSDNWLWDVAYRASRFPSTAGRTFGFTVQCYNTSSFDMRSRYDVMCRCDILVFSMRNKKKHGGLTLVRGFTDRADWWWRWRRFHGGWLLPSGFDNDGADSWQQNRWILTRMITISWIQTLPKVSATTELIHNGGIRWKQ